MEDKQEPKTSKKATMALIIIAIFILGTIIVSYGIRKKETISNLEVEKTIIKLEEKENKYMGINNSQIIKVTLDGVKAYDLEGQEVWSDTLSLDSIRVKQRPPYFAVSSKDSRKIEIFNETGKQGEITTQHPIIYFSVNVNGDVATIEETPEGHIVSAYNNKGKFIVNKVTYFKENGFPMSAEIAPSGKLLLIAYVGMDTPKITSNIQAIPLEKQKEEVRDMVKYGVKQENQLVHEIEFISDNTWVGISDKGLTWYNYEGNEVAKIDEFYTTYLPYLHNLSGFGGYIGVVGCHTINSNLMHNKEVLYIYDTKAKELLKKEFTSPVTYFYADHKGVIIGEGKRYRGFNKIGNQYFEYTATQDIEKMAYLEKHNKVIAITKDAVILLKQSR
ncbi:MAG: DUF5711 family protein [Cellulosilyticaceae bacterium]